MPQNHERSQNGSAPSWSAFELLKLKTLAEEDMIFNCVGKTTKGCRCKQPIGKADREAARCVLRPLPSRSLNLQTLEGDLEQLANLLLCMGNHRRKIRPKGRNNKHQVPETIAGWKSTILEENARAKTRTGSPQSRASNARPRTQKKSHPSERRFKQEEDDDDEGQESFTEQEESDGSDHEDDHHDTGRRDRTRSSAQDDFLKREKERCEEARRQSQRERAEQKESKAQTERERAKRQKEEEEAKRRREQPPPRPQPRPAHNEDWNTSWTNYRTRWALVADLPRNATFADLEKVFPWPVRNIHQLGLCISRLDAAFEMDVESFFRHMPSQRTTGATLDDRRIILKALRKEVAFWHPDKVLVQFPVSAVPKALKELATKVTQVLTRLMGILQA